MSKFNSHLKELTILYVEDETDIREELEEFFRNHNISLLVATNGQEGWELFEKHYPEIVISDIRMPILDGLELASKIKYHCPETQIILTTAHSDTQFFLRSIEISIDKYLLKPISIDALVSALNSAALKSYEHTMALEYEQRKQKDKIEGAKHFVIENLSDLYPFPTLVNSDTHIVHVNHAFQKFLHPERFEELKNAKITLDDLLVIQKGMLSSIRAYDPHKRTENKITIRTKSGRNKIFQVFIQELAINNDINYKLTILNDITFLEYQNLKIKHYNMALESYVSQLIYHQRLQPTVVSEADSIAPNETCELPTFDIQQDTMTENKTLPQNKEEEILRKHHHDKMKASEYVKDIDQDIFDNTREMHDYLHNISDIIADEKETQNTGILMLKVASEFNVISKIMNQLFEFGDLAYAIMHLSLALEKGELDEFDLKQHNKIILLIDAIAADLEEWINNIFVMQTAIDIHYLDASLFSVILQLEMELESKSLEESSEEEDDNDFELF